MLSACAGDLSTPIPTASYPKAAEAPARTLLVMLPGAGDRVGTYDDHGFIAAVRDSGMDVDMLEVDAHYGYYRSRTLLERMEQDVLAPNRDRYDAIWIVGISMGGIGALLTAWTYPEQVDGLVLIAPYLGRRKTLRGIAKAGGLAGWEPPAGADPDKDWDIEVWRMLKAISETGGREPTELYLMYGRDDFGVRAHQLLADGLPEGHVWTTEGGHAWTTWTRLWDIFLAEGPLEQPALALEPEQAAPEPAAPETAAPETALVRRPSLSTPALAIP